MLHSLPDNLAYYINRASQTPGGEELFKLGIHVFVKVSMDWKWLDNPYVDVDNLISHESKTAMYANFTTGCITFNEEAMKSISNLLKIISNTTGHGALMVYKGIRKWCEAHSGSPDEASRKLVMMIGEKNVIKINGLE